MSNAPVASPRVVVLKADRFYGDMIVRNVKQCWRGAQVDLFQKGFDALESIQAAMPDLFITGVKIDDMDGLEHLEPFVERNLPIFVVTAQSDARTLSQLRHLRYNGLFDVRLDGQNEFVAALPLVLEGKTYVSESLHPHTKPVRRITLDELTPKEELVLSVIGDGSDDQIAAEKLRISPHTVNTHRKSIMAKLRIHHKGQLICYAVQKGYVQISPDRIYHPGYERRLRRETQRKEKSPAECVNADSHR